MHPEEVRGNAPHVGRCGTPVPSDSSGLRPLETCFTGSHTPDLSAHMGNKALIVEDIREAEIELRSRGYDCDRITHTELLSSAGTVYTGKLLKGDYSLLWMSTPNNWHARIPTKKATAHWQRMQHWIQKAVVLGIILIVFGPPGFLWKMPNIQETIKESNMTMVRMRLCHFGDKFDTSQSKPSGSYLQLATTSKLSQKSGSVNVNFPFKNMSWIGMADTKTRRSGERRSVRSSPKKFAMP